ncbi:hypothetical protein [Sciscionella marina]|uniref:DUF2017 family protein n=1 Tax=Sciscionella marina TaxID=508770 RepID=UPI00037B1BA8|nr:hypothetical protein [Sciscionella marina]
MHDYVEAVPGEVPELRFSEPTAVSVRVIFTELGAKLSDRRDGRRQRQFLARFAPDVYPGENEEFHRRWDEPLRAEILGALERVLRAWDGSAVVRFTDQRMVDDWFIALAHARWLYVRRDGDLLGRVAASQVNVAWVQFVQTQLVTAAGLAI